MNSAKDNWSLRIGRCGEAEVRLHILWPLLILTGLLLTRGAHGFDTRLVCWTLIVLAVSSTLHECIRIIAALRVGGKVLNFVSSPVPGLSRIQLPADPPAHLLSAFLPICSALTLMMIAACGLALGENREVLDLIVNPTNPGITTRQVLFTPDAVVSTEMEFGLISFSLLGQLVTWVNCCLFVVMLLPADPCPGASVIRGLMWPLVGRGTAAAVTGHLSLAGSFFVAVVALLVARAPDQVYHSLVPSWFSLAVCSVFLLFGSQRTSARQEDTDLSLDVFDSDDEEWLVTEWVEQDREVVLVEHLQDKQQEALDRKRKEREASEDARVDAILARLHTTGYESLSDEERACLKRASRRYQRRLHVDDEPIADNQ